jgi:kinesin family protein 3/17
LLAHEKLVNQKLEEKIQAMESKLLCGGKNIIDHTNEQQRALEQHNQEIAERKVSLCVGIEPDACAQ